MNPLYTIEEFNNSKCNDKLPLKCKNCNKTFYIRKGNIQEIIKGLKQHDFCSPKCSSIFNTKNNTKSVSCANCQKIFNKRLSQCKSKNDFCSQSCAAIYNNAHKITGNRRSKLEKWLEEQLMKLYPNLEIHFNRKDTINSELDIYIPSLKLAFELNGIFHYEPIYGESKLSQIQNNDNRKFKLCLENNISLCIIDTSSQKYFKESSSYKYLDIICDIINSGCSGRGQTCR